MTAPTPSPETAEANGRDLIWRRLADLHAVEALPLGLYVVRSRPCWRWKREWLLTVDRDPAYLFGVSGTIRWLLGAAVLGPLPALPTVATDPNG